MEDGIEMNRSIINDMKFFKNNDISCQQYIYVHNKNYGNGEYQVIDSEIKAIEYSKKNNCRVDIYMKEIKNFYTPTTTYFKNGKVFTEE
jgi:hypothetical protein